MVFIRAVFFLLAGYHTYDNLNGVTVPNVLHLTPLLVLSHAIYEYRRLMHEAWAPT